MSRLSPQDRERMILSVWGLARTLAWRAARRGVPYHLTLDDLESEALLAACRAVETYDPRRGVKWSSYAGTRMTGALLECIREHQPQSRNAYRFHVRESAALSKLGPGATEEQIATAMGMTVSCYLRWRRAHQPVTLESLDYPAEDEGRGIPLRVSDTIPDASLPTQESLVERLDARRALESVPPRLRQVMLLHASGMTLREVGRRLGVSESRACQMEREGVQYARAALGVKP